MPPKVVMTTGAMSEFAKKGEIVHVATYEVGTKQKMPVIVGTNGSEFLERIS